MAMVRVDEKGNPVGPDLAPPDPVPGGGTEPPDGTPGGGANPDGKYDTSRSPFFKQGNNINDNWSTGAGWRPEAPTGGAYGAYAGMAAGDMNPLEQMAGYGYGNVATGGPYGGNIADLLSGAMGRTATGSNPSDPWLGNAMVWFGDQAMNAGAGEAGQLAGYQDMVNNGGYDAATRAAITNEGNNSITSQYEGLADQLRNATARTGSPLGEFAALSQASQNAGNQRNSLARQNQVLFANEKQRQRETGLQGLGQNAGIEQARKSTFGNLAVGAEGNRFAHQTTAANQANQFINDALQRTLQGSNGMAQLAAALQGKQATGAAGLAGLDQSKINQENALYSILASILGTKQEDYTSLGKTTGDFKAGVGTSSK